MVTHCQLESYSVKINTDRFPMSIAGIEPDNQRINASLAFIIVIIIIGIPMWWKTTQVYRVPLLYNGIRNLDETPIYVRSDVGIYTQDPERSELLINELNSFFKENDVVKINFKKIKLNQELIRNVRTPAGLESIILKHYKFKSGDFIFYEWDKLSEEILVTTERSALITKFTSAIKIHQVLKIWVFQEQKLRTILAQTIPNIPNRMRYSSSTIIQPHYDVIISIINPKPDKQSVNWNVRQAVEMYLKPFLEELQLVSNFTLKSQWKYQVPFEFSSKQIPDNSTLKRHYALSEEYLPHIITSIERNLGNSISDNSIIHLVVYVPPCDNAPLLIYDKQSKKMNNTNNMSSFVSPNWGGIVIANPSDRVCAQYMETEEKTNVNINSESVMQILLYILRKMKDIQIEISISNVNLEQSDKLTSRLWEIDAFHRLVAVNLINSATSTLQTLIKLLDGISNIVINDDVGDAINTAYANIVIAKNYLKLNQLQDAVIFARKAFSTSEAAFFDPTLLALLYFPDDQKYAIYIPLFLPIMIPVVLSIKTIVKLLRDRKLLNTKSKLE